MSDEKDSGMRRSGLFLISRIITRDTRVMAARKGTRNVADPFEPVRQRRDGLTGSGFEITCCVRSNQPSERL